MALQSSGPISLSQIAGEFGGAAPHSLSEYYGAAPGVPGSGVIKFSDFYGKSAGFQAAISSGFGSWPINDAKSGTQIGTQYTSGYSDRATLSLRSPASAIGSASPKTPILGVGASLSGLYITRMIYTNGTPNEYLLELVLNNAVPTPSWSTLTIPGLGTFSAGSAAVAGGGSINGTNGRYWRWNISSGFTSFPSTTITIAA
ncbi:hypothetical protein GTQ45_02010 [Pyruvatibacter mobilis]|uniref:Uncharacterized protein n=1 Tax=Pyruvatibacter mobilis TaxID=1712261 RepID=A0A845Q8S6_9HYPH|nr:hypothetical protein [Pyruvatibacter mobilis]NBG94506.1 hypothetical protein [Pyruvatibacter mobilis]QJD74026.1 hypothetical protein HG718_00560 [Pyruvatibacter mobilis]GGD03489.1 hypothetical protein GCM10011587_04020 [Pyruvatibacter mobilis]